MKVNGTAAEGVDSLPRAVTSRYVVRVNAAKNRPFSNEIC